MEIILRDLIKVSATMTVLEVLDKQPQPRETRYPLGMMDLIRKRFSRLLKTQPTNLAPST
jgi:hypothetical protein